MAGRIKHLLVEFYNLLKGKQQGQGMVEYALILVLLAVPLILVLSDVQHVMQNLFSNIAVGLNN